MSAMAKFKIGGAFLQALSQQIQETAHYEYRPDFPLTFSANSENEIWPFPGFGYSKQECRSHIDHPFLVAIVREYWVLDKNLGRFHVCDEGVFRGEEKRSKKKFIEFEQGLRFSSEWEPITQLNRACRPEDFRAFQASRRH
jgi:Fe-S oxidoreductase